MILNNPIINKYMLWAGLVIIMMLAVTPGNYALETGFSDKLNHLAAFLVLSLLALRAYPRMYLRCGLWLMLYGIVIEGIQIWIPGRSCSLMDLAADLCGIAAGVIPALIFNYTGQKGR
ncbi:MAG TPA: VanZ family protein [Spirochaetota bacterium]|nr:VanZ family protein [Spirochaetota bacterium]